MRRTGWVGVVVATLILVACAEKKEPLGPTATVPQGTTTTNPYAVPAVIDEAYVNRVLAGLDQAVGDATRLVVGAKAIPPEAVEFLRAVYVDETQFQFTIQLFQSALSDGFSNVRFPAGNRSTTVLELLSASLDCIFAEVDMDTSAVITTPNPAFRTRWVAIVPLSQSAPTGGNKTGWGFIYEGFRADLSAPADPCAEQ